MTSTPVAAAEVPVGFTAAGRGVDVAFAGTNLVAPLEVAFVAAAATEPDLVPVVAHIDDDGAWSYSDVTVIADGSTTTMSQPATEFSIRIPGWLNPVNWLGALWNKAESHFLGRTEPENCAGGAPSWGSVNQISETVHVCTITNRAGDGADRYEVRIKSNRGVWQQVPIPSGVEYAWVQNVPDPVRAVFAGISGFSPGDVAFLPPGGLMTIGFRQPDATRTVTIEARHTQLTEGITLIQAILAAIGVGTEPGSLTDNLLVAFAFGECAPQAPNVDGSGYVVVYSLHVEHHDPGQRGNQKPHRRTG